MMGGQNQSTRPTPDTTPRPVALKFLIALALAELFPLCASTAHAQQYPDNRLTPGLVATIDRDDICGFVNGLTYSERHRKTTKAMKAEVLRRYHFDPRRPHEIDHRVPLCGGGADELPNLGAEPGPEFKAKDMLEDALCAMLCGRTITPQELDAVFLGDWRVGYRRIFGLPPP